MSHEKRLPADEELLVTGTIRSSHGVSGFVKINSFSGEVGHLLTLSEMLVKPVGGEKAPVRLEIEAIKSEARPLLVKFKGIDSPEQAKQFAGAEILVTRDNASPLEKGEVYVRDLCQCVLVYNDVSVGLITGVIEGGESDLLEVTLSEGALPETSGGEKRFVPFRKEFVGKVDTTAKTVELMHLWILE
ncbi:MAG TPA: 16S rRNA processing protein RimM [Treponema sp.]|nr:16S rRNA processing protein RimM [Treponema sp.]